MKVRCPHCRHAIDIIDEQHVDELTCPSCHSKVDVSDVLSLEVGKTATLTFSQDDTMPKPGDSIGHFRIEKELGKGGFGSVYSAFDLRLERRVALKVPRLAQMKQWHAEAFVREAQAAAQLRDPNIVGVHEVGRDADRVYIVSDLIDGVTLRDWIQDQKPDPRQTAAMLSKIAKALHRAHRAGVIHRDVKPRNILVDFNGEPHITDFGLAKRESPDEITVTVNGQIVGTPAYMAPEQVAGKSHEADARTDVYALGVVLYEMLTGLRPFRGESDLLVNEIASGNPTPPRVIDKKIPRDLEAICLRAMSRNPSSRFSSAADMAEDLDRFLAGVPTRTRPAGFVKKSVYQLKKHRIAVAFAALVLLAGLSTLYAVSQSRKGKSLTLDVKAVIEPADALIHVALVDATANDGIIIPKPIDNLKPPVNGSVDWKLEPGLYRVDVIAPGIGSQTFYRRVPPSTSDGRVNPYYSGKEFRSGIDGWQKTGPFSLLWAKINLTPPTRIDSDAIRLRGEILKRIPGGTFLAGNKTFGTPSGEYQFPLTEKTVSDLYVGETEVTVGNFETVMGYVPNGMTQRFGTKPVPRDWPVTDISWIEAEEYCERIGARLPTWDEYAFVATNRGTTKFPWGNSGEVMTEWTFGPVKSQTFDVTVLEPRIFNLYSSVLEWTSDIYVMPMFRTTPDGAPANLPTELKLAFANSRVYVGGMNLSAESMELPQGDHFDARHFGTEKIDAQRPGLGFRVYRSAVPD